MRANHYRESGQLREFWGDDPPGYLVEAEALHQRAIESTMAADRKRDEDEGGDGRDRP